MKTGLIFPKRKHDVAVFGRVTIDLNPLDGNQTLDKSVKFAKYLGGSAGNIAVGLAKLGLKTVMVACLSSDQHGTFLQNQLEQAQVNTNFIQVAQKGEKTGLTFTEMESPTKSTILMHRADVADLMLEPHANHSQLVQNASAIVISGTALAQSPSREAVLNAIMLARRYHTPVVFDLDYRPYTWQSKLETSIYYQLVAQDANIIIGSRAEFNICEPQLTNSSDQAIANYYLRKHANLVIVKHGATGSTVFTDGEEKYQVAVFPIEMAKSFGGGDAYLASLLAGLICKKDLIEALTMASAHAAYVVSQHSCSNALMNLKELAGFINQYHKLLPVVKKVG